MKGLITLFVGLVSPLLLCSDLWAQCYPSGGRIIRSPALDTGGWRACTPPNSRVICTPRARQLQGQGRLQPLPPTCLPGPAPSPPPTPNPDPLPPPDPPPPDPPPTPGPCECQYDATMVNEILSVSRQNATKLDQLLEYAKSGPTADQLRQEHQRIEQLVAGAVTRLEEQHKQIQQDIRNICGQSGGSSTPTLPTEELTALSQQLGQLSNQVTTILALLSEMGEGGGSVIAEPSESMQAALDSIERLLGNLTAEIGLLSDQGPGEVNLTVDTPTFLEPDYIDMSLIWAQQKAAGLRHAVLVCDTSAASWEQLGAAYLAARAKFPPLSLYDVRSKNIVVKNLPRLVLYPKEGEPSVLSDPQEVVDELSKLARLP